MSEQNEVEKAGEAVFAIAVLDGHNKPERIGRAIARLVEAVMAHAREAGRAELDAVRAENAEVRGWAERDRRVRAEALEDAADAALKQGWARAYEAWLRARAADERGGR